MYVLGLPPLSYGYFSILIEYFLQLYIPVHQQPAVPRGYYRLQVHTYQQLMKDFVVVLEGEHVHSSGLRYIIAFHSS